MINGNANEFIDRIYTCQDTVFIFHGVKYWFQGYMPDENSVHMEVFQVEPTVEDDDDYYIWEYNGASISEGQEAFQNGPSLTERPSGKPKKTLNGWIVND